MRPVPTQSGKKGRGLFRAALGPLWRSWGASCPLQWAPNPQGARKKSPVGWGWCGAMFRACECHKCAPSWACCWTKGGTGGANKRALRHSQALYMALHHPQPTDGLWWAPCGSGGHCIGRKTSHGHHNSTKEAATGQQPSSSPLPIPRPGGPQVAPWPPQTPTNHPRGLAHHPCCLWGPLGGLWWRKGNGNMPVRVPVAWASSGVRPWSQGAPIRSLQPLTAATRDEVMWLG